ncbi:MAG: PEGA domain-containing protein [Bacteroidetes bacterium]|nr:PEGA domain-containing protein [Bacteroidota bacterium]
MKYTKFFFRTSFLSLIIIMTSCATIMTGSKQDIIIKSSPSGAVVKIDNNNIGITPITTRLSRKFKTQLVKIELDGFKPYEVNITREFNAWFIGNIFIGGIIGIIIDAADGAMYKLTPTQINAVLSKDNNYEEGIGCLQKNNDIFIAVTLTPDKSWEKIGCLEKL